MVRGVTGVLSVMSTAFGVLSVVVDSLWGGLGGRRRVPNLSISIEKKRNEMVVKWVVFLTVTK